MRGKASVLVVTGAALAIALLVVRQQRLQAVHEMTRSLERGAEHDRALWELRTRISKAIAPSEVRAMAERHGPMTPILREVCPDPEPRLHPKNETLTRRAD